MKPLAIQILTFALLAATAKPTLAHLDSLGQPDPYWEQRAAEFAARQSAAAAAADGAASGQSAADVLPFELFVYASGAMSLLLGGSLLRALRIRLSVSGAPAIRTVEVVPPSAHGETRLVCRAMAAIMFGALFVIGLQQATSGNDARHILAPLALSVLVVASWALRPESRTRGV